MDERGGACLSGGVLSNAEIDDLWEPWSPREVVRRMSRVAAPWYIAAGWALELFTADAARAHSDLEIAVPAARFGEVAAEFPGFQWDVVGDGRIWPFPDQSAGHHQTWLRDPATGRYRIDVFREPHVGGLWVCRRNPSITLSYDEVICRTSEGIPYATPEVALLFKAKNVREKDEADFQRVLPRMNQTQRTRLLDWLCRVHPGHRWINPLAIQQM